MAATPDQIAAIHRQTRQLRKYSDRLVGIGPFGIGLDGLLAWVPIAGTVYSVGTGAWLVTQAVRSGASTATIARMLGYMGFNTATSAVPLVGQAVDFLFQGQAMAAGALLKDIEQRHPHLKAPSRAWPSWRNRQPEPLATAKG